MPIKKETLETIARAYVKPMSSIRGRRVSRLLLREFSRFDHVFAVTTEDGAAALLALGEGGSVGVCRTDGRGPAAAIAEWRHLPGATVTTSYDLLKDSLPIVRWTISHPNFTGVTGTLTLTAADVPRADHASVADMLRMLGA